jgi:hypothetical protein
MLWIPCDAFHRVVANPNPCLTIISLSCAQAPSGGAERDGVGVRDKHNVTLKLCVK